MPRYDPQHWTRYHWQTDRRYYVAEIKQDLFGTWLCQCLWGALNSHRGSSKTFMADDYPAALAQLEAIAKRWHRRGYVLQSSTEKLKRSCYES